MHTEGYSNKSPVLKRWFPDRQIYFRAEGKVSFLTISTTSQTILAALLLAFGTWVAFSTTHVFIRDAVLEAKQEKIEDLQATSAKQANDMSALKRDVISRTDTLERRQKYLETLVETDPTGELGGELAVDENALESKPKAEEAGKGADAAAIEAGAIFWTRFSRQDDAPVFPADLDLQEFTALVTGRLQTVEAGQDKSAENLSLFAEIQLIEADDMLAPFKLKALDLANAVKDSGPFSGQGGPFIPIMENEYGVSFAAVKDDTFFIPYPTLHENWTRLLKVYTGFRSIPISEPAAEYYRSSVFGQRIDPVTNLPGWHTGVDLAGWKGTDVFSTEDGIVTRAGYFGTYGKYIEVDHGNGFLTRYGHLSKIAVNRGTNVKAGDVIGKMGCTGRCIGTHLHYEVVFNGKIRNPQIFMEAPEDVQETKRQSLSNDTGK